MHLVSTWPVDGKSNEITAIPKLLELLDLCGALVPMDTMACQRNIARQLAPAGEDYMLVVRDNQPNLLVDIQACFAKALDGERSGALYDRCTTVDQGHGRQER